VADLLVSRCVLTVSDREEIMKKDTQPDRNRTLLNILLKRPYETFQHLKDALREDPINTELVTKMTYSDGNEPTITYTKSDKGEFFFIPELILHLIYCCLFD
jgi:hypothetical protein